MESISFVGLRRCIALAFVRDHMNNYGGIKIPRPTQCILKLGFIVTINRSHVLQTKILEHALWRYNIFYALFHAV